MSLTIRLPIAEENAGRVITIKDTGAYAHLNEIRIERLIPDVIDGGNTAVTIEEPSGYYTLVSDGIGTWYKIGNKTHNG